MALGAGERVTGRACPVAATRAVASPAMHRADSKPLAEPATIAKPVDQRPTAGPSVAPALGPLWAFLYGGAAEQLGPQEMQVAEVLSPGQRRATRRAVLKGQPAWDEPSARFAVVSARAMRRGIWINPTVQAIPVLLIGLLFLGVAIESVGTEGWPWIVVGGTIAAIFLPLGLLMPFAFRKLERGEDASAALLETDDLAALRALPPPAPTPTGERLAQFAGVFAAMTLVRLIGLGEDLGQSAVGGLVFATLFVGVPWAWQAYRRR